MAFLALLILFLGVVLSSVGVQHLWAPGCRHKIIVILLAPGLIVHEMSHVLACLLTGATVTEVSLSNAGAAGKVQHSKPAIPILGPSLISLAPLFGCGACLWLVTFGLLRPVSRHFHLSTLGPSALSGIDVFAKRLIDLIADTVRSIGSADFTDWRTYVFFYLAAVLVAFMAPSKRDLSNAVASLLVVFIILFLAEMLGIGILRGPMAGVWPFLTVCLAVALFLLLMTLLVMGVVRLIHLLIRPSA